MPDIHTRARMLLTYSLLFLVGASLAAHSARAAVSSDVSVQQVSTAVPQVKLRFSETVSSANAKVGQAVGLEVVEPVVLDGKLLVAAGATARASVTTAKRRRHNRRDGLLVLTLLSVSSVDGKQTPLQSAAIRKGSGQGQPIFGPCTFPFPADPVGLFRKGVNVVIPKGTELVAGIVWTGS